MSNLNIANLSGHWVKNRHVTGHDHKRSISIEANKGNWILVAGRNGVGKTTLLNTIIGFVNYMSGKIFIEGIPLNLQDPYTCFQQGFLYVPQHAFFRNNLYWEDAHDLMRLSRLGLDNESAIENLKKELTDFGLIKQDRILESRVFDLITAIMAVPRILLLDEVIPVVKNLTHKSTVEIYQFLKKLLPWTIVIFTEHDLEEGIKVTDYILWLRGDEDPLYFRRIEKKLVETLLKEIGTKEVENDRDSKSNRSQDNWYEILRPENSPLDHIQLALHACSKKHIRKLAKNINQKRKLKSKILEDFPFLDTSAPTELLSGGQRVILSWFLLDFTGIGQIPDHIIQHIDTENRRKIIDFWSKYTAKKLDIS